MKVGQLYEASCLGMIWYITFEEKLGDWFYFRHPYNEKGILLLHKSELKDVKEVQIDGNPESRYSTA